MDRNMPVLKAAAQDAAARIQHKLEPHWQRIRQWSPVQRRMAVIISVMLVVSVALVAKMSAAQDGPQPALRARRNVDQVDVSWDATGVTYVRWGRTVCPAETQVVYEGVVGGGFYSHPGSGANYVCLPLDPDYEDLAASTYHAFMYGTEYQLLNFVSGQTIQNHNVPCAVCQSKDRMHVLMVPAKNVCHPGWHLEYNGYLVSSKYTHQSSKMFECLDHDPERDQAGYRDEDGALMYPTIGSCGSLPCPSYQEGKSLTCAVCTK